MVHERGAWDATAAVALRPIIPWRGDVWRAHKRRYEATDAGGSRLVSARYHRAPDLFPDGSTWAALYCGLSYGVCLAEVLRHLTPETLPTLKHQRLSKITVDLANVLDCRDAAALGIEQDALFHDTDYTTGQALGAAAVAHGCEGLLLASATRLPDDVLIIFPDNLRSTSHMKVIETVDPALYVERSS